MDDDGGDGDVNGEDGVKSHMSQVAVVPRMGLRSPCLSRGRKIEALRRLMYYSRVKRYWTSCVRAVYVYRFLSCSPLGFRKEKKTQAIAIISCTSLNYHLPCD